MSLRVLELTSMAALPWPTHEQRTSFVEHLCWAHSWYKHLPFAAPEAEFVVFLADDAGAGFETQERQHYTWKTTSEYRQRFGMIDYAWKLPDEHVWRRDAGSDVEPSSELLITARFTLGPLCSNDFNAIGVLCSLYPSELPEADPRRELLQTLDRLHRQVDEAFLALSAPEREAIVDAAQRHSASDEDVHLLGSDRARRYHDLVRRCDSHYESMRVPDVEKIESAIDRLVDALAEHRTGVR